MIVGIGVVFVVAGVLIVVSRRRAHEAPPIAPAPEPELPPPAELVWIPTAPRRRRPDSYGVLAPGALEDRAPRR